LGFGIRYEVIDIDIGIDIDIDTGPDTAASRYICTYIYTYIHVVFIHDSSAFSIQYLAMVMVMVIQKFRFGSHR